MHCQNLLPGKSGNVIKEDPESQYHLLQGSSGLLSVLIPDGRPIRHYLRMCCVWVRNCPFLPPEPAPDVFCHNKKSSL